MTTQPRDGDTRTMRERMLAGDLYVFDDPELGEANAASGRPRSASRSATTSGRGAV